MLIFNMFQEVAAEAVVLVAAVEVEEGAVVAVFRSTSVQLTVEALCKYFLIINYFHLTS